MSSSKPSGPDQEEDKQITRKQLSVQLSVLLATICAVFLLIGGAAEAEEPPGPAVEHVVAAGDTLWDIASEHVDAGDDVRVVVDAIKERSGIESSALHVGQVLQIPQP
jgi:nucleoid-associated protein YgaU